jgi:hypothetical protein
MVLVICCGGDENSENFFFTPDNENKYFVSSGENFHHFLHCSDMNMVVLRTMLTA